MKYEVRFVGTQKRKTLPRFTQTTKFLGVIHEEQHELEKFEDSVPRLIYTSPFMMIKLY